MTLQTDCLAKTPISPDAVQVIYEMLKTHGLPLAVLQTWLKNLCLSHERLRAELTGLEIVAKEAAKETTSEVASILRLLEEMGDEFGTEKSFRTLTDRLRKLVGDSQ